MTRSRIIVAGSPHSELSPLRDVLELSGYCVVETATADQAVRETLAGLHDVLIIDAVMEDMTGCELCRRIGHRPELGIILVIRDNERQTRIEALEAGADDYILAPFLPEELLARVRALLRRVAPASSRRPKLILSGKVVDLQTHEVTGPGTEVAHLTPKEFNVLHYLLTNVNKSVSHRKLARAVWQRDSHGDFEYLRVVIGQLRKKLEPDPESPRHIVTERSLGYRLSLLSAPSPSVPQAAQTDIPAMVQ
jgi:two-component system KDP operon response regulator KdpE